LRDTYNLMYAPKVWSATDERNVNLAVESAKVSKLVPSRTARHAVMPHFKSPARCTADSAAQESGKSKQPRTTSCGSAPPDPERRTASRCTPFRSAASCCCSRMPPRLSAALPLRSFSSLPFPSLPSPPLASPPLPFPFLPVPFCFCFCSSLSFRPTV
jgi:hypothetical protein